VEQRPACACAHPIEQRGHDEPVEQVDAGRDGQEGNHVDGQGAELSDPIAVEEVALHDRRGQERREQVEGDQLAGELERSLSSWRSRRHARSV
jgi:hypothetical protein